MTATVLHLSHTDIESDARILRELGALAVNRTFRVVAIGLRDPAGPQTQSRDAQLEIRSVQFPNFIERVPRVLRMAIKVALLTVFMVVRGIRYKPSVVHCHDTPVLFAGVVIKFFVRCKLIYDAHELESKKRTRSSWFSRITFGIEWLCWRSIDLLISVSESICDWYDQHLGTKPHVVVLNAPVSDNENGTADNCCSPTYFHDTYAIADDSLVYLYLGILSPGRGIEACLQVFSDPSINDHLVFMGWGELEGSIREYASSDGNIHLHEPVPHDQVVSLVASADVGLCLIENTSLSDFYCLPNKLFEYAAARIPVIASDFPEIRRVVKSHALGFCCAPEADSLQPIVLRLSKTKPNFNGRALGALSWKAQAMALTDAYAQLLGHRP